MTTSLKGFDLDALLAPISGDAPAGADPRQDTSPGSLYFRLRDARADARAAERQADAAAETDTAAAARWLPVGELAVELLTHQAKDLEAAAWCTEALLRSDGLAGLVAGFRLLGELVETYWDELFPRPDEDGVVARIAPVAGLNGEGADGTLIQPLRKLVLFEFSAGTPFAFWQYQQSAELAGIGDTARREQRLAAGVLPFDEVEAAARAAGGEVFRNLRQDAAEALEAWQRLGDAFSKVVGDDAPPTSRVRDLLSEIGAVAARYAPAEAPSATEGAAAIDMGDGGGARVAEGAPAAALTRIATREDALRLLDVIADYFQRTEPHSPLADTLHEAVRRGRLSWRELIEEIVPDTDNRAAILSSLGIRPPPPQE
jgi:type VI secretion system protein ImpA